MIVHLIDGTYELFRHFYGLRRFTKGKDRPLGAVAGVLNTVLQMNRAAFGDTDYYSHTLANIKCPTLVV